MKIKRPVSEKLSLSGELRFATDFHAVSYRHLDLGLQMQPQPNWQFAAHYRAIEKKSANHQWSPENRIYLQVETALITTPAAFTLKVRNRLDARSRPGREQTYRNRARIKLKAAELHILSGRPFASNEFFYDFSAHRYTMNRVDIGLDLGQTAHLKHSVYLKLISQQSDHRWHTETSLVYKIEL